MARFRKKPVEVLAVRWTGETSDFGFLDTSFDWKFDAAEVLWVYNVLEECWIPCLLGHWLIAGVKGEVYPCDPEVFEATYDRVE